MYNIPTQLEIHRVIPTVLNVAALDPLQYREHYSAGLNTSGVLITLRCGLVPVVEYFRGLGYSH